MPDVFEEGIPDINGEDLEEELPPVIDEDVPDKTVQPPLEFNHYLHSINSLAASQVFMFDVCPYFFEYLSFIGRVLAFISGTTSNTLDGTVTQIWRETAEEDSPLIVELELDSGELVLRRASEIDIAAMEGGLDIGVSAVTGIDMFIDPALIPCDDIVDLVTIAAEAAQTPTMYELYACQLIEASLDIVYADAPVV